MLLFYICIFISLRLIHILIASLPDWSTRKEHFHSFDLTFSQAWSRSGTGIGALWEIFQEEHQEAGTSLWAEAFIRGKEDSQGKAGPTWPELEYVGFLKQLGAAEKKCKGIVENNHSFNSLLHIICFRPLFYSSSIHDINKNVAHIVHHLVGSPNLWALTCHLAL